MPPASPHSVALILAALAATAAAPSYLTPSDWFAGHHGVFTHYLNQLQNSDGSNSLGRNTSWSDCVDEFNVVAYADSVSTAGARWAIITMMQGSRYLLGPNSVYDAFTGYAPGDACSRRDLVLELSDALSARGIALMLYWTGDGPHEDAQASAGLGWPEAPTSRSDVPLLFAQRWAAVMAEYAQRYAGRIAGWWVDGCYTVRGSVETHLVPAHHAPFIELTLCPLTLLMPQYFGYDDDKLYPYSEAVRSGNPLALLALNHGVQHPISRYSAWENYTCGESNDFTEIPVSRFVNGSLWHELSFIGSAWAAPGVRYSAPVLGAYLAAVNSIGGAVSIDAQLFRNGSINAQQVAVLAAAHARSRQLTPL